jgi:hypothetical protein
LSSFSISKKSAEVLATGGTLYIPYFTSPVPDPPVLLLKISIIALKIAKAAMEIYNTLGKSTM